MENVNPQSGSEAIDPRVQSLIEQKINEEKQRILAKDWQNKKTCEHAWK